ncbi:diguanylate cyclase/phosphodiesterase (GGDEF & EAL domains) with PAS/PAC sensor(s) [hydrothermal vent metagenome]|uniref:histidine kinase n=1 Tax=hydrothermal vent metagenome TaxID=652676 RepID=A0A3B1A3E8_9ZZZZ
MKFTFAQNTQNFRMGALLAILLFACALIIWNAIDQHHTTKRERTLQVKTSLDGASQEIAAYLQRLNDNSHIIANTRQQAIQLLLDNPLDFKEREKLINQLRKILPDLSSLTIANNRGALLLEDNQNKIEPICRAAIRNFAYTDEHPLIEVHSSTNGNHFDILSKADMPDDENVILYLRFNLKTILRLLGSNKIHNYDVLLLHKEQPGRVEVEIGKQLNTEKKARTLSVDDYSDIQYKSVVPGTQWELVAIHTKPTSIAPAWTNALWAFSLLLLLGSTALWLLRRTDTLIINQSEALKREQRRINNLQQTTISSELSFHEKVRALLVMGLDEFGMEVAILSRVEGNIYSIVTAVSPDNSLQPGMSFNLGNTYCRHTLNSGHPTGIEKTELSLGKDHPYYTDKSIASYIGTAVYVRGKVYGTLNFSSFKNYDGEFNPEDFRFLQLMSQWIGLEIERRESEQQSQTKNQLLESISRAQSYFISENIQPNAMFDQILSDLLALSYSNVGFIAEIKYDDDSKPYVEMLATGQRYESSDELMKFIEKTITETELTDSKNVLSEVIRSGAPIISNNIEHDKSTKRLADGSPPLNTFLGVPLYHGTQLVGTFGLANSPDGYHESFLYTLAPLATASANLIWALRNESQRIHTEHALRESEEQLKLALEGANDGLWDWDIEKNIAYFSPRWQTMLGFDPGEIRPNKESKEELIHPADLKYVKQTLQEHLDNHTSIYQSEHRVKTKDGHWIWVLDRGKVVERSDDGKPLRMVGTHTDITERKLAEEAVRERETRIAAILDTAVDGIITINDLGVIETFNPAAEKIFEYEAKEVLGRNVSMLMQADDRNLHDTFIKRYLSSGNAKILGQRREVVGLRANGTTFPMQLAVSEMKLGDRLHFTGIIRDITATKEAERLLEDTMAFKQGILDSAKLSIISTDANGVIQTFNAAAQQMLGYSPLELVGRATPEIFHDRDEITQRAIQLSEELGSSIRAGFEVFVAKARSGIADEQQWTYISKNGKRFPVVLTMTALHDPHDNIIGFVAIARDISRQQEAEEEISRFKTTLDMTLDCVYMFSPESLRYFYVNQGAMEQIGYTYKELLRMSPVDILPEYDENGFRKVLRSMITGQRNAITFESYHQHRNGSSIPVEVFIQYIYPVDQEPRFVAIVRDITERRRTAENLAHAEERARMLLESAGEGIYGMDLEGRTTFVNPAAARILSYDALDLIGKSMHELIQHSYQDKSHFPYEFSPTYAAISQGDIQRVSNEVMWRKDGTWFPVEYTVTPLRKNDYITGAVVIFNDITERKKVEQIKNEFISTVSHELRTPLTSVRGSLGLLVGGAVGEIPEAASTLLSIANKNTERLLLLINDILDIEKIESGKMVYHYKLLNLQEFIESSIQANNSYGEQFGVKYEISQCPDVHIYADGDRLMQVMNNLLSNAAKFSAEQSLVEISAVRRSHKIRISITDNGKGIPQNFQKHIFEKFAQADASDTRALSGTGLGLSISRAIVEQHGGRIDFISRVNIGTTFFFDLPVWTKNEEMDVPSLPAPAKYRILICENDADIAFMLRMILAQAGFDADIARTVEQAKFSIKDQQYLAVTLDLSLPDERGRTYDPEGIKLVKELRRQDRTRELPIIVVSAIADQAKRRLNGRAFGIIDWLEKPLNEDRLLSAVKRIATHKQGLPRILHVEDDPIIYEMVKVLLRGEVDLVLALTLNEAHQKLRAEVFDLILLDIELTDGSGLDLINDLDDVEYMPQVVIFSSTEVGPEVAQKVKAALVKTKDNRKELINVIMSVIKEREMQMEKMAEEQKAQVDHIELPQLENKTDSDSNVRDQDNG